MVDFQLLGIFLSINLYNRLSGLCLLFHKKHYSDKHTVLQFPLPEDIIGNFILLEVFMHICLPYSLNIPTMNHCCISAYQLWTSLFTASCLDDIKCQPWVASFRELPKILDTGHWSEQCLSDYNCIHNEQYAIAQIKEVYTGISLQLASVELSK